MITMNGARPYILGPFIIENFTTKVVYYIDTNNKNLKERRANNADKHKLECKAYFCSSY